MAKSKSNGPGVHVNTKGSAAIASTMKPVFGRGKGRKAARSGKR